MALVNKQLEFMHILRINNTNVDGRQKVPFALTAIRGVGRRMAILACKKAGVDVNKRAGEVTVADLEKVLDVVENPQDHDIPVWMLNRQKDLKTGQNLQVIGNTLDNKLREDLEAMKKIRCHRGLRHYWGLRVRGQHTKTTGRRGNSVGVAKKKGL